MGGHLVSVKILALSHIPATVLEIFKFVCTTILVVDKNLKTGMRIKRRCLARPGTVRSE